MTTYRQRSQTGVWDVNASFLPAVYIDGLTNAGGTVLLLPPQPVTTAVVERVLDSLDGLVITGGSDIDPARYGQEALPTTEKPRADRDAWEFALLDAALRRKLPVLGICRGAQVLNVALGGTLIQHLPDAVGHSDHRIGNAQFAQTPVATVPGTRVAEMMGPSSVVRCYHHQAIDRIGDGLIASAHDSGDGLVEAVELDPARAGDQFAVAVQWHPEETLDHPALFEGIVAAATRSRDLNDLHDLQERAATS
ncbi:gamma-glutamyl-gamma-aminobutyrate hydrolase family protein [Gordonia sp. TBRC 11910]|uniref:Gamma-glutamyl-gamma-aminobutyrate hydrolase family protein n=1 Tax=Gordonia asplenii TaxID=2725283 RepID=A0A848KLX5_9ACTN|nr:gamma-glutamyl-gamma-aminobutyrate hydrolase family protein [Gordonia asplenii]NMN99665.1 gamma-glutamyl-gamma-aminobutyrate hydrolase family protein [Gordonia asplenii]